MTWTIVNDDVVNWAAGYTGQPFHALLSDAPYEISFGSNKWDSTGIAFDKTVWAALAAHLLPGGFLAVFASSIGWHRLACALEDAGLIIHPTIFNWVRAGGWPKSSKMESEVFAGHRYGKQAMKPAVEPIILAQKPYEADAPYPSILKYGAGALNIDATRIPGTPPKSVWGGKKGQTFDGGLGKSEGYQYDPHPNGRYPANFTVQHDPACTSTICADTCPVSKLHAVMGDDGEPVDRYFHRPSWQADIDERLYESDPVKYASRPTTQERDAGVGEEYAQTHVGTWEGLRGGPREDYVYQGVKRNNHPTVKPIELTAWLAKLLLPPVEYAPRRLLVPFSGSFSEGIGGLFAGFEEVVGIEREPEFCAVGRQRALWWEKALAASDSRDVPTVLNVGEKLNVQGRLL